MARINMILMASMSAEYHAEFLKSFEEKGIVTLPFETSEGIMHVTLSRLTGMV